MKTVTNKIQDSLIQFTDTLSQQPILKGVVPGSLGVAVHYIDHVDLWIRRGTLYMGFIVMGITLAVKLYDLYKKFFKNE